jgi:hypothetical protein
LWRIIKDGLTAFFVWLAISVVLIYFLGYPGRLLAGFIGIIFLACFIVLRFVEIVFFLKRTIFPARGYDPPNNPPPPPPTPPPPPAYCPKCGAVWVAGSRGCASCGG